MLSLDRAGLAFQLGTTTNRMVVARPLVTAVAMEMPIDSTQRNSANASADPSAAKVCQS